jgi:hypothetical protein
VRAGRATYTKWNGIVNVAITKFLCEWPDSPDIVSDYQQKWQMYRWDSTIAQPGAEICRAVHDHIARGCGGQGVVPHEPQGDSIVVKSNAVKSGAKRFIQP